MQTIEQIVEMQKKKKKIHKREGKSSGNVETYVCLLLYIILCRHKLRIMMLR